MYFVCDWRSERADGDDGESLQKTMINISSRSIIHA